MCYSQNVKALSLTMSFLKKQKRFVEKVEKEIKVPINLIGTGPDAWEIADRRNEWKS